MKTVMVTRTEPKTKQAALNYGAYVLQQLEFNQQRKENLMTNIANAEEKIKRLQSTIAEIDNQIQSVDKTRSNWQAELDILKTKFLLTESEILETKSELLRRQITNLQKQAGVTETGKTRLE